MQYNIPQNIAGQKGKLYIFHFIVHMLSSKILCY